MKASTLGRCCLLVTRFTLRYERKLNDDLGALGMQRAFIRGGADFTAMSPEGERLYIDFVRHDTYVDVHEKGTEAAAVTTVGVGVVCACEPPRVEMRVDLPFLFAIRERHSGTIQESPSIASRRSRVATCAAVARAPLASGCRMYQDLWRMALESGRSSLRVAPPRPSPSR